MKKENTYPKEYYQLNQLDRITGLSRRMLFYKMKDVKEKFKDNYRLLHKTGKSWQIHYTIIDEFMPIKRRLANPKSLENWQTFVTWNPLEDYSVEYHYQLIQEIKERLPDTKIKYAIELDKRGNHHTHFICDAVHSRTKKAVKAVLDKYFKWFEVECKVGEINNKFCSSTYILKAPLKSGVL